ncbi:MAG: colanic acid biosynthesis glycosyltransferase WcaL [Planctomycetes bacterium]|nr:colanic acid biosynthesis glycosyltransferase WcaL [Planctomycetota bacterium]
MTTSHDPMVVVHSVPGSSLPLTQGWLLEQVRRLPPRIESHVVSDEIDQTDRMPLSNVHTADRPGSRSPIARLHGRRSDDLLRKTVLDVRADVIHSHSGPEGWNNLRTAEALDVAHVVSFHGADVGQLPQRRRWRSRYRSLFRSVDRVLCEGDHMADRLAELGCPQAKLLVHRIGVDLASLAYRPRTWDGHEPLRVLLAATFLEKKGLPLAVEALGRIAEDVDLSITIVGDATPTAASRSEKARLETELDRSGLRSRTTCIGFQPWDVLLEEAYAHHLHIAPSLTASDGDTEGGAPITLIALVATGMPVVSTRHCDIPGVIWPGVTGYLAREHDVDDLELQIRRSIDGAPQWPKMLDAGLRWIADHFDAAAQGERLAELYERLVGGPATLAFPTHAVTAQRRAA